MYQHTRNILTMLDSSANSIDYKNNIMNDIENKATFNGLTNSESEHLAMSLFLQHSFCLIIIF